jgi:hypothetical protein
VTRDEYVESIKSTALLIGRKVVVDVLVAQFSKWAMKKGLATLFNILMPIANPILGFLVGYVLTIAIKYSEFGAFFLYIDLRSNQQGRDFEAAALKNLAAQKSGTEEDRKNAEKELINSFRTFIKFTS